jgi:carbonic anhydrase
MNPLRWTYVPENTKCLVNPGLVFLRSIPQQYDIMTCFRYCWRVDVNGKDSELTGGPLNDDVYLVEQFHCHW